MTSNTFAPLRPLTVRLTLIVAAAACAAPAAHPAPAAPPPGHATAEVERPIPYPPFESPGFARAVERGTRTRTGRPGPSYWQQHAEYRLQAQLDPATTRLTGSGAVRYHNRSPDTLRTVAVHLYQNLHRPGARRNREVPVTGGMALTRVAAQGRTLPLLAGAEMPGPGYRIDATVATLLLPAPLPPAGSLELEFDWEFTVPGPGTPRMGQDGEVFFLAYWYPQMAVYDDVSGWHTDPYLGNAEFHMGFGDYEVTLTLPEDWLVSATGTLQNPEAVLSAQTRQRLEQARRSAEVVRVVTAADRSAGRATVQGRDGLLSWRFAARRVRDFAWGASDRYLWDATHAVAGDATGDGRPDTTLIHSLYRPGAENWDHTARYGRHSVEFLSEYLWPYPWPHMSAVEGPIGGGMEFPMITLIGGARDTIALYSVTVHEIAHMWFPMLAASDEKRHTWLDEGLTRFHQAQAMQDFFPGYGREGLARDTYLAFARTGGEVEMMRHGDLYPVGTRAFGIAGYDKPAVVLVALRAILGEETFHRGLREFGRRWEYRHPQPWDLWNTFEDVSGRDLGWFWRTWYYETWTLDQAVAGVRQVGNETEITIEDRGYAPMPVLLAVTRADGTTQRLEVPVEVWLSGARRHTLRIPAAPAVTRIEIDPEGVFPDLDRANNVWVR
jgi:hypothetical protein